MNSSPSNFRRLVPARVALEHKHAYELLSAHGGLAAECTGRLLHAAAARAELPAVGDWVVARLRPGKPRADIHAVLSRKNQIFPAAPLATPAANKSLARTSTRCFLVTALDQDYNLRRIERYLTVAWESGAQPVVLLNKSDLHADPAAARAEVESIASGAPVLALSAARDADPAHALAPWLLPRPHHRFARLLGRRQEHADQPPCSASPTRPRRR